MNGAVPPGPPTIKTSFLPVFKKHTFLKTQTKFYYLQSSVKYGLALRGDLRTMDQIKPVKILMKTRVTNTSLLKHKQNLPQYYKNSLTASQPKLKETGTVT
jgi:hypothetical protein